MSETLHFPSSQAANLQPYLPDREPSSRSRTHLTLTFATSLDSTIALHPGTQTALSGPESKAMTHHLRSRHRAILIGAGTAIADDPGLNCRIDTASSHPRPVVLDPRARWKFTEQSKVLRLAAAGKGLAPFVLVSDSVDVDSERRVLLERLGGRYIPLAEKGGGGFAWEDVLELLGREGLESVMVEGGGVVINSLLSSENIALVDSVIVTIAPTWLGKGGVVVSPDRPGGEEGTIPAARLTDVRWCPLGEDVVLCGRPKR